MKNNFGLNALVENLINNYMWYTKTEYDKSIDVLIKDLEKKKSVNILEKENIGKIEG